MRRKPLAVIHSRSRRSGANLVVDTVARDFTAPRISRSAVDLRPQIAQELRNVMDFANSRAATMGGKLSSGIEARAIAVVVGFARHAGDGGTD